MVEREAAVEADPVAAAGSGDRTAFERLAEVCGPRLYRAARRLCRDPGEAEDLAQEALVRGFLAAGRFRGDAQVYTYLYRTLLNLWKNRLRSRGRWRILRFRQGGDDPASVDPERFAAGGPDPLATLEENERAAWVREGLMTLDPTFREVLVLREAEGLDYREIAGILRLPVGTVRSRLARARARLRQALLRTRDAGSAPRGG
ncbi:MAG: sigma-70 family RNA polymerase sigma factor [Acidobacteria bacterium]|nr:sigma-70 family RNA polymerase sigma factor [Acidobacteriota bacterium]